MLTKPVRTVTVFLADRDVESRAVTSKLIAMGEGCEMLGSSGDGCDVVEQVIRLRPDVLVTDLLIPGMDGFSVIRELRERMGADAPASVILADYTSPALMRDVRAYSVSYYFLKPVPGSRLIEAVRNASENREESSAQEEDIVAVITDTLLDMGVPAHLKGYQYLRESILLALREPGVLDSVTKLLYPTVAKTYGTEAAKVERAMRHAIEVSLDRGNIDAFQRIFGYTVSMLKGKPTNSEFIAMIADHLSLRLRRRNGERMFTVR